MEGTGKPISEMGLEALSDRLKDASLELSDINNKPDFRELDLGSPVSPLRSRASGPAQRLFTATTTTTTTTTTSSSSSSSGSFSGRLNLNPASKGHSGELSGSTETSPKVGPGRVKPGHRRTDSSGSSGSHPLIYAGGLGGGSGGGGGGSVNSPPLNVLPAGNICPSGRVKSMPVSHGQQITCARKTSRTDVLGSGTVNYGHGSIMRAGGAAPKAASCPATSGHVGEVPGNNSPVNVRGNVMVSGGGATGNLRGNVVGVSGGGVAGNIRGNVLGSVSIGGGSGGGGIDPVKRATLSSDPEELKKVGNDEYKRGHFIEALTLYDRAIAIAPTHAAYRSNRAAALTGLGRIAEAVRECEEAIRLDPCYGRAHQRLGSLLIRLGQVEAAKKHLCYTGHQPERTELHKLQAVEKHLTRCSDARIAGDWKCSLREGEAAIAAGADYCPQLLSSRAESLLKLQQLDDIESLLLNIPKIDPSPHCCSHSKFFGMLSEAYLLYVRAQIEMTLGRFENAVACVEKAGEIDPRNAEIAKLLNNVRLVTRARARGNDLYKSERFTEACAAYGEGLKLDPSNSVIYCNRAACWAKLGMWERSIEDCNHALRIHPNYTKALLRRAASNNKLERWAEAVRDYEVLRKELPHDTEVAEALFHAQVALKKSRGEEVFNMKFGGDVEEITGLEHFRATISSPGVSVIHFEIPSNPQCKRISSFLDTLCDRYPSINFLKVDIEEIPDVANIESVRIIPTFKIYKNGNRVKEIVNPTSDVLEASVRHYSF